MFLLTVISATAVIVIALYLLKRIKFIIRSYNKLSKVPGPPGSGWIIGNLTYLHATPEIIFQRLRVSARKFYPLFKMYALHKVTINIVNPEDCELVLSNPAHNNKGNIYMLLSDWLKNGLLTSEGQKWQTRRRILTPAFHFSILQQFVQVFNEESEKLVQVLKIECKKSYVNVNPHISQFTLKAIAETAMGTKLHFNTERDRKYKQAIFDIVDILLYRLINPWLIFPMVNKLRPGYNQERKLTNLLHSFTKAVIKERKNNFTEAEIPQEKHDVYTSKRRLAMLDLLLTAKKDEGAIDDEGIQEEVDTFMFEGHDTTAAALSFALMLIACHKDVQEKIVNEIRQVLGDVHRNPTFNDLQNFKYMERCIKETLRLYPSVFFISRCLGEDLVTNTGLLLPRETETVIHIYDIHHNPDIYPDPEKFDPDRFLPENVQGRHPFAYVPFSAGPRNCIGQKFAMLELKATICAVLRHFVLQPIDTPETIVLVANIILRTKEDIKIRFVPRSAD